MKIRVLIISALILMALSTAVLAQRGMIGVHAGYMNPKDTKSGLVVGGNWGTSIDESVSIGLGFDFFHTAYNEETRVASETANGMTTKTYMTEMEYSRTILPLMAEIDVKIPMGRYLGYLIRGGLGYSFLWSNEKNFEKKTNENRNYDGFTWQAAFGLYYDVGSRSTFIVDLFYNNGEVSREVKKSTEGLPVSERVNLSGLGVRVGVILTLR
jgi:hypothetical protein